MNKTMILIKKIKENLKLKKIIKKSIISKINNNLLIKREMIRIVKIVTNFYKMKPK